MSDATTSIYHDLLTDAERAFVDEHLQGLLDVASAGLDGIKRPDTHVFSLLYHPSRLCGTSVECNEAMGNEHTGYVAIPNGWHIGGYLVKLPDGMWDC